MAIPTPRSATAAIAAITVTGLRRSYGKHVVLDSIDLSVPEAKTFALLGPNGAGKTTMVNILSTLISADSGQVTIGGHDLVREPDAVRSLIGLTGQFSAVDTLLTAEENLWLMADLNHLPNALARKRIANLLQQFELTDASRKPVITFSGGMRRRLDLAMTLVGDPRIIFLDEPTTGLDPRSRRTMWQMIRDLVAGGVTIFLTTQYLEEADELADRVALLDHGKLIAQGTPEELKRLIPGGHIEVQFTDPQGYQAATRILEVSTTDEESLTVNVPSDGGVSALRNLLDQLDRASIDVADLSIHRPDLDDVFLALTGQPERTPTS